MAVEEHGPLTWLDRKQEDTGHTPEGSIYYSRAQREDEMRGYVYPPPHREVSYRPLLLIPVAAIVTLILVLIICWGFS